MPYQTLAIMLGYTCNARCRSCLWGDKVNSPERMDVEKAKRWMDEAFDLFDLKVVGFSGGETFIFRKELEQLSQYALKKHGVSSAASTNCYWATSPVRARVVLERMYARGLHQLLISADEFHQEYVPLERVRFALQAARELGIISTVQTIVTNTSKKLEAVRQELGLPADDDWLHTSEIFCTRIGSAVIRIPEDEFPDRENALSEYCSLLRVIVINPDGEVNLCCGPAFAIPELSAGNLNRESLKDVISAAEWSPINNALALGNGPSILMDRLPKKWRAKFEGRKFSTSCEACQAIHSKADVIRKLDNILDKNKEELFMKWAILEQEPEESLQALVRV